MFKLHRLLRTGRRCGTFAQDRRQSTAASHNLSELNSTAESFEDYTVRRQAEAQRSVVLKVDSLDTCAQAYHHYKQFGEIKNAFVYPKKEGHPLMLLEFENTNGVKETFKNTSFMDNTVHWLNRSLLVDKSKLNPALSKDAPLQIEQVTEPSIKDKLRSAKSFDEQANLMFEHTSITDAAIRLKYITALQAQSVLNEFLNTILPNATVYPFGSTVNGFGKTGCDLDMILRYDQDTTASNDNQEMPLVFQGKNFDKLTMDDGGRLECRQVKCMASLIEYFVPESDDVKAIVTARVPIVRYNDTNIANSVDLSVNNLDGFHITEYMFAMGALDPRIRPFIFMVRRWYKETEVTRFSKRESFTNFQLSYMCLHFLQQLKDPLIPTFYEVMRQISNSVPKDIEHIMQESFMFHSDRFQFQTKNTSSIHELFVEFLQYFESYEFSKYIVTLRSNEKVPKPETIPPANPINLYLENIFEPSLPWGFNVTDAECSSLQVMARDTLHNLEHSYSKPADNSQDWGILKIIRKLN